MNTYTSSTEKATSSQPTTFLEDTGLLSTSYKQFERYKRTCPNVEVVTTASSEAKRLISFYFVFLLPGEKK